MRLVEAVPILSSATLAVAIALLGSRRRLVRRFETAGVTSPDAAIPAPDGSFLARWWLRRLLRAGVLQRGSSGGHWLDPHAWSQYRRVRRRRALTLAALATGLVLLAALASRTM